jgi:hypothetical protein
MLSTVPDLNDHIVCYCYVIKESLKVSLRMLLSPLHATRIFYLVDCENFQLSAVYISIT